MNENARLSMYRTSVRKSSPHGLLEGIGVGAASKMNGTTRGKSFVNK